MAGYGIDKERRDALIQLLQSPQQNPTSIPNAAGVQGLPGTPSGPTSVMSAYNPSWRDQIGGILSSLLSGDGKSSPEVERLVSGAVGSTGLGNTRMSVADLTPAGMALSGNEAVRAAQSGHYGEAALNAAGALPLPMLKGAHAAGEVVKEGAGAAKGALSSVLRGSALAGAENPKAFHPQSILENLGGDWQNAVVMDHTGNVVHGSLEGWNGQGSRLAVSIGPNGEVKKGLIAYHGSPHDFDKFDLSKIGTGEGAQAYGHGLYFAENEGVAKGYKSALSRQMMPTLRIDPSVPENIANVAKEMQKSQRYTSNAQLKNRDISYPPSIDSELSRYIDEGKIGLDDHTGRMYQVRINADPEHFLDWDKPLNQQSPKTQEAVKKGMGVDYSGQFDPAKAERLWNSFSGAQAGTAVRQGHIAFSDEQVAKLLRDAGIPGIKYLDQGSRGAGEGSRNYVVFDPQHIEILKKYGLIGALLGGAGIFGNGQDAAATDTKFSGS